MEKIIIIMSWRWHGFPWLSLTICLNRPSHSAGPLDNILTEMLKRGSSWLFNACPSVWWRPQQNVTTPPAVFRMIVRLIWLVLEMGGTWLYSSCFVGYCHQDFERWHKFFDIVAGVLQGETLAPYLFIICLDYLPWMSIDLMKENGFILGKAKSRTTSDADSADDIAIL